MSKPSAEKAHSENTTTTVSRREFLTLSAAGVGAATAAGYGLGTNKAHYVYENIKGLTLDPSQADRGKTSKMVIDATRQLPEEGGPQAFPELNRTLLEKQAPQSFERVDTKYGNIIKRGFHYQDV